MVLPGNYRSLSYARQTFVLTDLERVDRGLRPLAGLTKRLTVAAQWGAYDFEDPVVNLEVASSLNLQDWQALWAHDLGPLAADYHWMYEDGRTRDGPKVTGCTRVLHGGCWAHRAGILEHFPGGALIAGAAAALIDAQSVAEVMAAAAGPTPKLGFSWAQAVRAGADAPPEPARSPDPAGRSASPEFLRLEPSRLSRTAERAI
jgi:hypothetical protein